MGRVEEVQRQTTKMDQNLARIAELPAKGTLEDFSSRFLLAELSRRRFSGVLILRMREKSKKLYLSKGEIFRIQSNLKTELFGQMAVDRQLISPEVLQLCILEQKQIAEVSDSRAPRIGQLMMARALLREDQILWLERHQFIGSLIQALSWNLGAFEVERLEIKEVEQIPLKFDDLFESINSLFAESERPLGSLFKIFRPWNVSSGLVSLSDYPVWSILAGCRLQKSSGILTIRKEAKLFEIVIKEGVPMIFYEGLFQKPRQTVLVRQTSDEHEAYFREQIFRCFTFVSGNASFRTFDIPLSRALSPEPIESTQVVKESDQSVIDRSHSKKKFAHILSKVVKLFRFR